MVFYSLLQVCLLLSSFKFLSINFFMVNIERHNICSTSKYNPCLISVLVWKHPETHKLQNNWTEKAKGV